VFVAREPAGDEDVGRVPRWHLSIAHPWRDPSWDEIKAAREQCLPPGCRELHFVMPLPPPRYWLNFHPHCFHLWEVFDPELTAQWEAETG
jgi:hypothetical protein